MAGAFWALAFEYPGMNLEQAVFGAGGNKKRDDKVLQKANADGSKNLERV